MAAPYRFGHYEDGDDDHRLLSDGDDRAGFPQIWLTEDDVADYHDVIVHYERWMRRLSAAWPKPADDRCET